MIGRKQRTTSAEWWEALRRIEELIPSAQFEALFQETVEYVRQQVTGKRVAFGWSGGKDSLALQAVMEEAGVKECVLVITDLEYREFLAWCTDHMPWGLEIRRVGLDLAWLAANPEMLFPQNSNIAAKWFHAVQHRGQEKYFHDRGLDLLALGRRRVDGNYLGQGNIYTARGVTRWAPLAEWTHEEVLALIHYRGLTLPPTYEWPRGWQVGTGPWPARQWTQSVQHGWSEVWSIDPEVVQKAALVLPSAAEFLQGKA